MSIPTNLKYAESHEWSLLEDDIATVGISDFAQESLGDVVYVELPEVGSEVQAGDAIAVVESVKAASDIYAPLSGEVVEVNEGLDDAPETINEAPYEGGWLFKLRIRDSGELDNLLDAAAYEKIAEDS